MHDQLSIGVWRLRLILEGGFTGDRVTEGNGIESLSARPPTPDADDAVCIESHPGARFIHQRARIKLGTWWAAPVPSNWKAEAGGLPQF